MSNAWGAHLVVQLQRQPRPVAASSMPRPACPPPSLQGDSHDIAVNKGRGEIQSMIDTFNIRPREDCLEAAHRLYRLALQQGFTKGRRVNQVRGASGVRGGLACCARTVSLLPLVACHRAGRRPGAQLANSPSPGPQVAAACLYIICRQEEKPFMLIDYSDLLQVGTHPWQLRAAAWAGRGRAAVCMHIQKPRSSCSTIAAGGARLFTAGPHPGVSLPAAARSTCSVWVRSTSSCCACCAWRTTPPLPSRPTLRSSCIGGHCVWGVCSAPLHSRCLSVPSHHCLAHHQACADAHLMLAIAPQPLSLSPQPPTPHPATLPPCPVQVLCPAGPGPRG